MSASQDRADDFDGSSPARLITFSFDGMPYRIYLSDAHAAALRHLFASYITAGRRLGKTHGKRLRPR